MADTTTLDIKPKRNKPCENCRTHRRKCILTNVNVCERCQRMTLVCYFKFSQKPPLPSKKKTSSATITISPAKKTLMIQQVQQLDQLADALAEDLDDLHTNSSTLQQQQRRQRPWQICIQRSSQTKHLIMDTNFTSINDLLAWMQQAHPRWPMSTCSNTSTTLLVVTLGPMPVEKALRDMFSSSSKQQVTTITSPPPPSSQHHHHPHHFSTMKRQLIDLYFTCTHLHNPLLVASYFHPYMRRHPNDMISWAAAAYMAYSYRSCHHVQHLFPDQQTFLMDVGEVYRLQAKELLDHAMFLDDSPSVLWIFTAYLLTHLALMALRPKEARIYGDACWHMAMTLKDTYVPHNNNDNDNEQASRRTVYAESWRRLYMGARFLAISMNLMNGLTIDVAPLASHAVAIDFPHPLPDEPDADAIVAYGQLCQLYHVAFMGNGERLSGLAFRLYLGKLASVRSQDVAAMETRYVAFWYALPAVDRVGTAPLDYLSAARLASFAPVRALRVNITYYLAIMSTALRIMPDPAHTDLTGVSLNTSYQQDPARAVLVVSVCCDAVIRMYQKLAVRLPCTVELHWVSIVLDTVLLLIHAKHADVRHRALQGARIAKALFRQCVAPPSTADTPESASSFSTSSTSSSSSSSSTLTRSPSPPSPCSTKPSSSTTTTYRILLAQEMDAQLASKDDYFYL